MAFRLRTNGKINLFLRVVEKLPDGFHSIETIFQSVSLADDLIAESGDGPFTVETTAGAPGVVPPAPEHNIVTKAAAALAEAAGVAATGRISVTKNIPVGGGLAGGSGNAAGALIALEQMWGTSVDFGSIAPRLGSDVPFCLLGGTALGTGRGERLTRLALGAPVWFVLGISFEPLLTAEVYSEWRVDDRTQTSVDLMLSALHTAQPRQIAAALRNDLEAPALRLRPDLVAGKVALLEAGALGACVSGSGPTIFALAADEDHARQMAVRVAGNFDRVEVVTSRKTGVEKLGPDS
jgi:4-diphosphocytidyl-2-C-methyl-D-erythritol kinase